MAIDALREAIDAGTTAARKAQIERQSGPTHWRLDGWHAVAGDGTGRSAYVRGLIDWGSHEFSTCPLSYRERLAIIESAGEGKILAAMAEISEMKQRTYVIDIHGKSDMDNLRRLALADKATTQEN